MTRKIMTILAYTGHTTASTTKPETTAMKTNQPASNREAWGTIFVLLVVLTSVLLSACDSTVEPDADATTQITPADDPAFSATPLSDAEKVASASRAAASKSAGTAETAGLGEPFYSISNVLVRQGQWVGWRLPWEVLHPDYRFTAVVTPRSNNADPDLYIFVRDDNYNWRRIRFSVNPAGAVDRSYIERRDLRSSDTWAYFWVYGYSEARFDIDFYATREPTTMLDLKMPLAGGNHYAVSTEIGGYDACDPNGTLLYSHVGLNYYSIDITARTLENGGRAESNVVVYPAAGGKVVTVGTDANHPNGYHVVVDHDYDGNLRTGFSTRYLHLRNRPWVSQEETVGRSDALGYMGDTGEAAGVHLHFGVRYKNEGYSYIEALSRVRMEGLWLDDYETGCSGGQRSKYYLSTNTR